MSRLKLTSAKVQLDVDVALGIQLFKRPLCVVGWRKLS